MPKCRDIISFLEQIAPVELAEEWDNTGFQVGNRDDNVDKVLVCLDITSASVKEALSRKVNLIVTHHPLIFKGLKRVIEGEEKGDILYELIRNGINVYSAHTNLDYAESGVNDHLARTLRINKTVRLGEGPGLVGEIEKELNLDDFISSVKKHLNVPFVRVVGKREKMIKKVAVFCGSFDGNLNCIIESGADVLVTGDLKYHSALEAVEEGICIIDAGHFNTEKIIVPVLAEAISGRFPQIDVYYFENEEDPFKTC
mgnify:CR=1 FL=1